MSLNSLKTKNRQITKSGTDRNPKTLTVLLLVRLTIFSLICLLAAATAYGQAADYTNNSADQKLRGSGRVNASSLAMEFSLPMGNYPGRGINLPINLSYSSKVWRMAYNGTKPNPVGGGCHSEIDPKYAERSASGWTTSLAVPFIEYTGAQIAYLSSGEVYYDDVELACDPLNPTNPTKYYIRRVTLHLPSGETHELRLSDTEVELNSTWDGDYYAVDGSNIIYKQNSANNIFKVMMPDGSAYDLNTGSGTGDRYANKYTDRNGNFTTYHNDDATNYPNGYWKDTLDNNIRIPLKPQAPTSAGTQTYSIPGISGNVTYTFYWKQLKGSSAAESGLTNFNDSLQYSGDRYYDINNGWQERTSGFLYDSVDNDWIKSDTLFNPIVLTRIDLPNGEKYKFTYNVHGEIETIKYPTGGEEKFVYGLVQPLSRAAGAYYQSNRGVTNRKVYETAGTGTPSEWDYATSATSASEYIITTKNPDDTKNVRFLHRGNVDSYWGFDNALAGMPYREFSFSSAGVLQTQNFTYWTKSGGERHPRVVREDNIIYDSTGSGLSSTAIYEYEGDLSYKETPVLINKTTAYAFETVSGGGSITPTSLPTANPPTLPSAPSTPVRITETTYLINDPNYATTSDEYKDRNMIGLVTASQVKNGSGTTVVSRSEIVYDDGTNYPIISAGTSNRWQNPNTNYRGNPTTLKVWDSTKGAETSSGAYIATHAQFDNFGNQRKAWDALGNLTETAFSSTYDYAFPTSVTSAAPDQNGGTYGSTTGFTTSATFDATSGLPLTTTDVNGQVTEMEYDAATLRLESVTAPNGHVTEYVYGVPDSTTGVYAAAQRFIKTRTQIDASSWKESYSWVDGLGRGGKGREIDSNGNVEAKTEYDIMGRVKRSTNPYRIDSSGNPTETVYWTTPTYDALGRTIQVASPDTATVQIAYGISTSGTVGITKTVTDQASKKRKGITDALGNMIRVIEDPDSQALVTDYVFDTLGNLRKTTQTEGQTTQNRYFSYDSLGRLLRAKQPEQDVNTNLALPTADAVTGHNQWSVKYVYDDTGNITSTTDARNKTITATYDHLNRLILRDYSDSSMPDVTFYYDGKGLSSVPDYSKGKTTKVTSSVSETRYTSFDNLGRLLTHQQITDGQTYSTAYSYNLSGALIEETYPSTRKVKITLNGDGEVSMVQSKKNSNHGYYAYALGFTYDSAGSLTKMRLGNGHWETYAYNNRLQVTQIGLGTTDSTQDFLKLEFGYGTSTQNNGSLREQKITVPTSSGNTGFTATQTYTYDNLNRLESAAEIISSTQSWKQTFSYDRFGNRRFNTTNNNTTTIPTGCSTAVCNPQISTTDNRFSSGQGYSYDADGNLTQDAVGQRFGYDAENHQKEFFTASNGSSNPDTTYFYDGEGRRVKKITNTETVIFVYNAGGKLVAEYSTQLATTPQVSYLTTDHLGSARIITNENGQVTGRKDYTAFGEEVVTSQRSNPNRTDYTDLDEIRQGYTGYEKDTESGLEYAQARYYNTRHGRFTSVDPLTASASIRNPQTFNRYSYVLNSPYKFTDPLGLLPVTVACGGWCPNSGPTVDGSAFRGRDASFDWVRQQANQPEPPPPSQTVDVRQDKIINKKIQDINKKAKPLKKGETPVATSVVYIQGQQTTLTNATVIDADGNTVTATDSQGNTISTFTGYMRPVAVAVLDQGGNIMVAPQDMFIVETVTPISPDAKAAAKAGALITTNNQERGQANNGLFYDLQLRNPGSNSYNIVTNQDLELRQYYGPKVSDYNVIFEIKGNVINNNDAKKSITVTLGKIKKIK